MTYGKTLIDRARSQRPDHLPAAGRNCYRPTQSPSLAREIRTFTDWYDIEQKRGSKWVALVVYMGKVQKEFVLVQRWLPMDKLRPVYSSPEQSKPDPY
jgi:hypothetical protein